VTAKRTLSQGTQFAMLPRDLLESDAWRSAGINVRRVVDFLLLEHMRHAGKANGQLKAPYEQLEQFGVGARYMAQTIREAEDLGLIDCRRHGMRSVNEYSLNWLPLHDGTTPNNRWREFKSPDLRPIPTPKAKNLPAKGKAELPAKGKADDPNLPAKGKADCTKTLPAKGKVLSRISNQGGAGRLYGEGAGRAPNGRVA
jgi:hypothetical protein